jgi:hypothetical protein
VNVYGHVVQASVHAVQADFAEMDRAADRASMYALRQTGRVVKQEGRKRARVYQGPPTKGVVKGALKNSISSSKRLRRAPDGTRALTVGPRGPRVHLYAQKIDRLDPFMGPAYSIAVAKARGIHELALERALKRVGR